MNNLIEEIKKQNESDMLKSIQNFKDEYEKSEEITFTERHMLDRKELYKGNRELKVINRIKVIFDKRLNRELDKIKEIKAADTKMPSELIIIINFYKSATWGYCPKGTDNYGHSTSSITGCGYCKESTATAELLNQNLSILKKLYKAKNKNASAENRDLLGYGCGSNILPRFEGGVGVGCHVNILEKLGYKVKLSGNSSTTILTVK